MAERDIKEYLASGEAGYILAQGLLTSSTIDFTGLTSEGEGLFTRINENGQIYGYRAKNQDVEMVVSDTTDITAGGSETLLVELTIDNDVTQENGSWAFTCKVNNGSGNKNDWVTLVLRDGGGSAIASKQYQIDKGDLGYPITMWGDFSADWASGSVFRVYATSNENSKIMGTMTPTTLKVVEAQAAPISAMATAEKPLLLQPAVKSPRKSDFLSSLASANELELIESDFTALATNGNEYFQVFFSHQLDEFFSHQIMLASNGVKPDIADDMVLSSSNNYGNSLSRAEIESDIDANGYERPSRSVVFYITDSADHCWLVKYIPDLDKYAIEKLTLK